jgi:cyclase
MTSTSQLRPPPARIIARLDIKGPKVIKGVHLEGLRVVGRPGPLAQRYYAEGADEIIFMDTVASLYGRNNIMGVVEEAAREIFVPMTVGGGIRSVDDIVTALRSGADKVAINTAATHRPELIGEAARALGSQCIVLSIEAKQRGPGQWEALTDNGRQRTGLDVCEWAQRAEGLGAGEILLTSVDKEGTRSGFDHALFKAVRDKVRIPVIGCGGAGKPEHVAAAITADELDAVGCASLFHYDLCPLPQLKQHLNAAGLVVRA